MLGFREDDVPVMVVHDTRGAARQLLVHGHYARAYATLEPCWQGSVRSIQAHLGVPLEEALACFAARRCERRARRKPPSPRASRQLGHARAYIAQMQECGEPIDVEQLIELL